MCCYHFKAKLAFNRECSMALYDGTKGGLAEASSWFKSSITNYTNYTNYSYGCGGAI